MQRMLLLLLPGVSNASPVLSDPLHIYDGTERASVAGVLMLEQLSR